MEKLCDYLIDILEWWSADYYDYATLNILLFVVAQPLLILIFMFSTIYCSKTKNERWKKIWRITAWSMMAFWFVVIAVIMVCPMIFKHR